MTEEDWLEYRSPTPMLNHLEVIGRGNRKYQLLESACWQHDCGVAINSRMSREEIVIRHNKMCYFIREIFGNPFRPVTLNPLWLTPTVQQLAALIYEERQFDKMPLLGDALEEA